jgi:hypothetical protein
MSTQIVTTESSVLIKTKSPALPNAPGQYDISYQNQLNNVLRLYFNALDQLVSQLNATKVVYTFDTLPDSLTAQVGDTAFVTDSSINTFYSNVAGSGSYKVPVFYDGTNWKVG